MGTTVSRGIPSVADLGGAAGFLGGRGGEFSVSAWLKFLEVRGGSGGGGMLDDDIGALELVVVVVVVVVEDDEVEEGGGGGGTEGAEGAEEDEACVVVAAVGCCCADDDNDVDVAVAERDGELFERLSPPRLGGAAVVDVLLVEAADFILLPSIADASVYVEAAVPVLLVVVVAAVVVVPLSSRTNLPLLRSLLVREIASTAGISGVESPGPRDPSSSWSPSESVSAETPGGKMVTA
ncbi:hypothetical protein EGW08_013582 [Elysia chlorotica]|uniref:Uncharacterized protein n=1 Tax=Elysia chlorotica TaxID=188477 RepID=A0A433TAP1_ELYCH|nr:hypothetical protein EGW08_013582 [Elysia chlorotica]